MARPRSNEAPDLTKPCNLTAGAIERLACPPGKAQASGIDPRELERQQAEAAVTAADERTARNAAATASRAAAATASRAAAALTVGEAGTRYVEERRQHWGERNHADHVKLTQPGGEPHKRLHGVKTTAGPLAPLMCLRLVDLDGPVVEAWAKREAVARPARVRLALRLLNAFLRWAAAEPDLKGRADPMAASAKKSREAAGKPKARDDYLQREQLAAWFKHVRQIQNPVPANPAADGCPPRGTGCLALGGREHPVARA